MLHFCFFLWFSIIWMIMLNSPHKIDINGVKKLLLNSMLVILLYKIVLNSVFFLFFWVCVYIYIQFFFVAFEILSLLIRSISLIVGGIRQRILEYRNLKRMPESLRDESSFSFLQHREFSRFKDHDWLYR